MIKFSVGDGCFQARAVAVITNQNHILFHKPVHDSFWTLAGGRIEMQESAEQAVLRELKEELNIEAACENLMWVIENFFVFQGKNYHEIGFYFKIRLPEQSYLLNVPQDKTVWGQEGKRKLMFQWISKDCLADKEIRPFPVKSLLMQKDQSFQHIVYQE